jgi:hypothetical protein
MSRVDVVVPCYNYGRFLERCVDSVLDQERVDVRVLIIDDASSDDTPHVGERLAAVDQRVELRRHDVNQGHIATYNEGLIGWASAKYSLLLSADDVLAPGALARATQLMERHSDLGMTYGMALTIADDNGSREKTEAVSDDYRIVSGSEFLQFCCEICWNPVPALTAVVRTELQHHLGGYSVDFPHTGDMEMWMRFAVHMRVGVLRAVQGYYRWHGRNMGSQYYNQMLGDRREFIQTCKYVVACWSARIPECGLCLKSMFQRLDQQALGAANKAFNRGDMAECRAWLELAEEISSSVRPSRMWWRLRVKRFLGHALWQRMRPAVNRIRGIRETPSELREPSFRPRPGEEIGWWPGST